MASENSHHHGQLRAALVAAGLELVGERGPAALTIRGVAARVGVSHAAPAHHFRNLAALRSAVIAEGHRRFTAEMEAAIADAPATPRDAVIGAAVGYLRFARAYPGLFDLMFGVHDRDETLELTEAGDASYAVLARVCAPFATSPDNALPTELLVWSFAHGFSALATVGHPALADPDQAEALLRTIFPDLPIARGTATETITDQEPLC